MIDCVRRTEVLMQKVWGVCQTEAGLGVGYVAERSLKKVSTVVVRSFVVR